MLERAVWSRVLPFGAYIFFIFLADLLTKMGWTAQDLRWLYVIKISIVAMLLWLLRGNYDELRLPRSVPLMTWGIAVFSGVAVFVMWINLHQSWMVVGASGGFDPRGDGGAIDWPLAIIRVAGAALVVPVMEELFWRSFLMRWVTQQNFQALEPARAGMKALIVTSALFAVEHNLWLAGLLAGLVYGWLYIRSGTVWSPIVAHAVTNGVLGAWVIGTGNWGYW